MTYGRPPRAITSATRGLDAAIDRGAVGVAGEAYFRSEHSGQPVIAFGPRWRRAPIDGDAAQSRERRHGGAGPHMVRQVDRRR